MVRSITRLRGSGGDVVVSFDRPTVIIGRLARPGPARSSQAVLDALRTAAVAQEQAGAGIVEVHLDGAGLDEAGCLPELVQAVARSVAAPLCVGARDPEALRLALALCPGKPIAYLIDQQTGPWRDFLSVAAARGAAVIVQAVGPEGVPQAYAERVETARRLLRESITAGIARDDVIVDPMAQPLAGGELAAAETLKLVAYLAQIDAINLSLRISAVSAGLPDGELCDALFIARALAAGVTCPFVDATRDRLAVGLGDLLLGREGALLRYRSQALQGATVAALP